MGRVNNHGIKKLSSVLFSVPAHPAPSHLPVKRFSPTNRMSNKNLIHQKKREELSTLFHILVRINRT